MNAATGLTAQQKDGAGISPLPSQLQTSHPYANLFPTVCQGFAAREQKGIDLGREPRRPPIEVVRAQGKKLKTLFSKSDRKFAREIGIKIDSAKRG
jgi:hypothetical protein